ncbi:DUF6668 family protein [Streptomyces ipomoeae]|uniref:DUF6668 family protein n=1 Tax=Streptomyces ipomoeae TaxID=103232 RepID=UPI0011466236|nr:DUF6668 family protein [Streptomyces ipomoeae]MDX2938954.1 hypothetical protein [Streptomyces ipomoeae]TQE29109.1 hypothetical protein SipoB123_08165 [Streptomyces ipomoeae]
MQGSTQQGAAGPEIWLRGPVTEAQPQPQPPEGQPRPVATARRFSWVATHGGAGSTTLATVFGGHDAGRNWPRPEHGEPGSVLLVGRTHAAGLDAVSHTLDIFRRGDAPPGLDLDAIVLVADAPGRLPRQLVQRVKVISSVIDVYRVPWVPAWRTGDLNGPLPRESAALARLTGRTP